jgi:two-component system, sensor histidine kinase and response regulator
MNRPLILVVEDNAVLQKVMQLMCRRQGVDADIVSDGTQALTAYESRRPYQIIFMDWRMPDMDGLECTKRIRQLEQGTSSRIPIVAMTANADAEDREVCFSAGMDDYLSKPFTSEEFARVVSRWLGPDAMAI